MWVTLNGSSVCQFSKSLASVYISLMIQILDRIIYMFFQSKEYIVYGCLWLVFYVIPYSYVFCLGCVELMSVDSLYH